MTEFPRTLKIATVWLLLGVLVFLGFQALDAQQHRTRIRMTEGAIELQRGPDGHYHWPGRLNGHAVEFLVDTGATRTAISEALAREVGLELGAEASSRTANGVVRGRTAVATLTLEGGLRAERLPITVLPAMGDQPLLGMDVLGRLQLQQRGRVLRIDAGDAVPSTRD